MLSFSADSISEPGAANQRGFTLIELMIVVAILAIIMAIAIPAYQDYTIRSQVTEGMNLAGGAKAAVWDYWSSQGTFPGNNGDAGLPDPASIGGEYVSTVAIDSNGEITVTFGAAGANAAIAGKTIVLKAVGAAEDASIAWRCDQGDVPAKYRPARCRS